MSGLDKNRQRNKTISFRVSTDELQQIEARIIVSGMPKGQFYRQAALHRTIRVTIGKYQSDRLSLEIKRLREHLEKIKTYENEEMKEVLEKTLALLQQLIEVYEKTETGIKTEKPL